MMFLVFLASLAHSADSSLQFLTDKTFGSQVLNHPSNEVWIVMFMTDDTNETRDQMAAFKNASDLSAGIVRYGILNVRRAPAVTTQLELKSYPCYRIFSDDRVVQYVPKVVKTAAFMKTTLKFVHDLSQNVTESWKDNFLAQPAAILFTNSNGTTALWKGISSFFLKKSIKIGICRDQALIEKFGIKNIPSIVFYNGTNTETYKGGLKFKNVRESIEKFFEKRFVEPVKTHADDEMLMPDQFKDICIGGKQLCVLAATKTPPEGMAILMKESSRRKLRCFAGIVNLPYKFMEKGGVWIYNPRRDGFIHIQTKDSAQLLPTMDRIIDGTAKWTRRSEFESAKETPNEL